MNDLLKISVDMATLLDPYKLAIILSGLDRHYSEIFIPQNIELLSVSEPIDVKIETGDLWPDENFIHTFDDSSGTMEKIQRESSWNGYSSKIVEPNNFLAAMELLRKAKKKGMVSFLKGHFDRDYIVEYLGTGWFFYDSVEIVNGNGKRIRLVPDYGGSLEELLYFDLTQNIKPIFGNEQFMKYLDYYELLEDIKTFNNIDKNEDFELLLRCPQSYTVDELFEYLTHVDLLESFNKKITNQKLIDSKTKDISLIFLSFIATLAIDALIFNNVPVSSGALVSYQIIERLSKPKKNSTE